MSAPDFIRARLITLEIQPLRIEQRQLVIAKDGTVSYSYTFSDYLRVNRHDPGPEGIRSGVGCSKFVVSHLRR